MCITRFKNTYLVGVFGTKYFFWSLRSKKEKQSTLEPVFKSILITNVRIC